MRVSLALLLLLGCAAAKVGGLAPTADAGLGNDPFQQLDQLASNGKHKSWCTFKARAAKIWCDMKAKASFDAIKRQIAADNCNYNYNLALQQCPKRRLATNAPAVLGTPKHKSWCSFKAAVANKWCQTKAIAHLDKARRQFELAACATKHAAAKALCPARRLEARMTAQAAKHKSWCTFKAWVAKSACKTKALSFNAAIRNQGNISCENNYNLDLARCAQRKLMRDMEKAIAAGNAHEGWCEFKNRSKWLWCKVRAGANLNADARRQNLAKCDADYNLGDALCRNQATVVTVNTGAGTSTATIAH